ncbi:MAG: CinA family nicotinamide mononucleotide deamidase-related protein [Muribaculaceae bacterium]|nr:CinA family nicotinamide mononucleotide deamidase-related protein [Muribaculaceae bacterium]
MKLSIVIIGDEILLGRVTDTNSGLVARTFAAMGWTVAAVRTVGDKADDIRSAIEVSLAESELVVTTGGLGPTRDDITKTVMMSIFGGELVHDDSVRANIEDIFADRHLKLNELTLGQAYVPSSCRVIQNRLGTAPIMCFERGGHMLVAMPGVPFETRGMLPAVADAVRERFGLGGAILHREFTVTGISESALAEQLAAFEDSLPAYVKLAYLPNPGEIILRLDADFGERPDGEAFEAMCSALKAALGPRLAAEGKLSPAALALHALRSRGYTLATAESCTGGNIAHLITAIAGCSDVYRGGVVSYANEVKSGVLGVDADVIAAHGAVSEPVVRAMAEGAARVCGADCAVATSGIAGPGGGTPDKPVGTVWIGVHTPAGTVARCVRFSGDREAVIDRASAQALMDLVGCLELKG